MTDGARALPCPFCGEAPNLIPANCCADRKDRYECETPGCTLDTMTLEAWNRRTPDPATQRVLKALEAIDPMEHCDCDPGEGCPWCRLWLAVEALAGREGK